MDEDLSDDVPPARYIVCKNEDHRAYCGSEGTVLLYIEVLGGVSDLVLQRTAE